MKVTVEFPGEDRIEEADDADVVSRDGHSLFLIGKSFFVEIDDMRELAFEIIRLGSNEDSPSSTTDED